MRMVVMPCHRVRCVMHAPHRMAMSEACSTTTGAFMRLRQCHIHATPHTASTAHSAENHQAPYILSATKSLPLYFSTMVAAAMQHIMATYITYKECLTNLYIDVSFLFIGHGACRQSVPCRHQQMGSQSDWPTIALAPEHLYNFFAPCLLCSGDVNHQIERKNFTTASRSDFDRL